MHVRRIQVHCHGLHGAVDDSMITIHCRSRVHILTTFLWKGVQFQGDWWQCQLLLGQVL